MSVSKEFIDSISVPSCVYCGEKMTFKLTDKQLERIDRELGRNSLYGKGFLPYLGDIKLSRAKRVLVYGMKQNQVAKEDSVSNTTVMIAVHKALRGAKALGMIYNV